jgi:hypothetical protein
MDVCFLQKARLDEQGILPQAMNSSAKHPRRQDSVHSSTVSEIPSGGKTGTGKALIQGCKNTALKSVRV